MLKVKDIDFEYSEIVIPAHIYFPLIRQGPYKIHDFRKVGKKESLMYSVVGCNRVGLFTGCFFWVDNPWVDNPK